MPRPLLLVQDEISPLMDCSIKSLFSENKSISRRETRLGSEFNGRLGRKVVPRWMFHGERLCFTRIFQPWRMSVSKPNRNLDRNTRISRERIFLRGESDQIWTDASLTRQTMHEEDAATRIRCKRGTALTGVMSRRSFSDEIGWRWLISFHAEPIRVPRIRPRINTRGYASELASRNINYHVLSSSQPDTCSIFDLPISSSACARFNNVSRNVRSRSTDNRVH